MVLLKTMIIILKDALLAVERLWNDNKMKIDSEAQTKTQTIDTELATQNDN